MQEDTSLDEFRFYLTYEECKCFSLQLKDW